MWGPPAIRAAPIDTPCVTNKVRIVVVVVASLTAACGFAEPQHAEPDPCGLPQGTADLDPATTRLLVRRSLACTDHRFGRITDEDYRRTVAAIDATLAGSHRKRSRPVHELSTSMVEWATSVIDYSTQYSETAWSAQQVLGAPDVFPAYGDQGKAWASHGADDRDEYIEVGFAQVEPISAVEVFETYNPGAIDKIELITRQGRRIDVAIRGPAPAPGASAHRVFETRCTREPIASVRVHLDSKAVAGWNELDAIGVVPCTR